MEEQGSPSASEAKEDQEYISLMLSISQIKLLRRLLEETAAPRGYANIKMVCELFEALEIPEEGEEKEVEVFE